MALEGGYPYMLRNNANWLCLAHIADEWTRGGYPYMLSNNANWSCLAHFADE